MVVNDDSVLGVTTLRYTGGSRLSPWRERAEVQDVGELAPMRCGPAGWWFGSRSRSFASSTMLHG